jgi:hypothetical protein
MNRKMSGGLERGSVQLSEISFEKYHIDKELL